jgi:antitoxin (DNA-binding transcriptional repressor) of toxin-antitoxin stability system
LEKPMTEVSVTILRQNLPAYLAKVRRGERIQVTSRGRVIAEIAPPLPTVDAAEAARARLRGSLVRYDAPLDPVLPAEEWESSR